VKAAPKKEVAPKAAKKTAAPKEEQSLKSSKPPVKEVKAEKKADAKAAKPAVKEASAFARDVRVTPRKVRLVMDCSRQGRQRSPWHALPVNRAASAPVSKLIKSAAANATNNFGLDGDKLYVAEIQASDGIRMKRFTPRAKGSPRRRSSRECRTSESSLRKGNRR
jgi:large subunit ribosomal protein L22